MACAEALNVQAYFDGEVDPATAAAVEQHVQTCAECRTLLQDLKQLRALVRDTVTTPPMPAALRHRITQSLDREAAPPSRPFWIGVLSGAGASAVAATAAFVVFSTLLNHRLLDGLVADHVQSLTGAHLIEVVSTDQHTVKPWFAGRTDVSPEVADFSQSGYRLLGGRVDDLDHQRAAVLVYQHGPHYINVFSWVLGTRGVPRDLSRNGYHLAFWKSGNLGYCAVSDTGWPELQALVRLIQEQTARDVPQ